ncbi:MAG: AMP phosphorylase [Candidatus Anstonellaceae archaeon]
MKSSEYNNVKEKIFKIQKLALKVRKIKIMAAGNIVVLNSTFAFQNGIYADYRIKLENPKKKKNLIAIVDLTNEMLKAGEIGLFENVAKSLEVEDGQTIYAQLVLRPQTLSFIKEKIEGKSLSAEKIDQIIKDAVENRLSDAELASFMTACYINGMSDEEIIGLTNTIVRSGQTLKLNVKPVVDKHCIGGVAGNRTTMLIVPIVAAAGCYIPKTSSRAITSAAGTADTMEVLANVSLEIEEIEKQTRSIGGCIVWGGAINLAAADDKLIKIRNPLSLDPKGVLLASILAKKKAVGAKYCIIDIPVGRGVKIEDAAEAKQLASDFINIGRKLGIEIEALITNGEDPIGNGIGPALECKDVLEVLEGKGPHDLREKSLIMAGKLLELAGKVKKGQGVELAAKILDSKKALKKFQEIVEWQGGKKNVSSKDISFAKYKHTVYSSKTGRVSHLDNKLLARVARAAGAPADKEAGIYLYCEKGDMITKGQPIMEIYSNSEAKLSVAIKVLEEYGPVELEKVLLDSIR